MNKQNKIIIGGSVVIAVAIIIFAFIGTKGTKTNSHKYDAFAQCLTDKGFVMYGAEWCSHCKATKAALGDSFKLIKYVECPDNTQICLDKGVQGYPTWIMGTSTEKIEGFDENSTFKKLSEISGCALPTENK